MAGLIPLLLKPTGNFSHITSPTNSQSSLANTVRSTDSRSLTQIQPILSLLPYTRTEWKCAIAEIQSLHISGKYGSCTARCSEIFDNIKKTATVEPIYSIYLHFYAAELFARPLVPISPHRLAILQKARQHFVQAAKLMDTAEESAMKTVRAGTAISWMSTNLSCHSPIESISSHAWSADTNATSPTSSVHSCDDVARKAWAPSSITTSSCRQHKQRAKKVSFSLPPSTTRHECRDPEQDFRIPGVVIRPDSPTLGLDDDHYHSSTTLQSLPEPPKQKQEEVEMSLPPPEEEMPSSPDDESEDDVYLAACSAARYCAHLSDLRAQLTNHAASLETQLRPATLQMLPDDNRNARDDSGGAAIGARQSNQQITMSRASTSPSSPLPLSPPYIPATAAEATRTNSPSLRLATLRAQLSASSEEIRAQDKQSRIERLRSSGWQRRRFDAGRYEQLRDQVMAELVKQLKTSAKSVVCRLEDNE